MRDGQHATSVRIRASERGADGYEQAQAEALVDENVVDGWDDPRMPTISGLRRLGYTPEAIRNFVFETGISKAYGTVDRQVMEHFIREDLKLKAPRTMAVLDPLKVVITNYPEGQIEWLDAENNTENPEMGIRQIPFSREIYIEQEDFMEDPPSKYFRLFPGNEVRLKHAYFIKCNDVIKDENGKVVEIHCTYDPETKSGALYRTQGEGNDSLGGSHRPYLLNSACSNRCSRTKRKKPNWCRRLQAKRKKQLPRSPSWTTSTRTRANRAGIRGTEYEGSRRRTSSSSSGMDISTSTRSIRDQAVRYLTAWSPEELIPASKN